MRRGFQPDDRALRQTRIDECAWLRHDQILLPGLVAIEGFEIGEGDSSEVAARASPDSSCPTEKWTTSAH